MKPKSVTLLDAQGDECAAALRFDLKPIDLIQIEAVWGPFRTAAALKAAQQNAIPEHSHWDWSRKAPALKLLGYKGAAIACGGETQGVMLAALAGHAARSPGDEGKELVYIEYIETAPWNYGKLASTPRYKGVGIQLVKAAIELSGKEGFHGRVGLHSLPQSEETYEKFGMTRYGADPSKEDLVYFEFSRTEADRFLKGRRGR